MIGRRLTFANVISTIALFVALGGASYAATQLPKGSVGTKQLRNGAVTAAKVKSGSLSAAHFATGELPTGPQGPKGDAGPKGDPGERGEAGKSVPQTIDAVVRYGSFVPLPAHTTALSYAACDNGEVVTGGGYDTGTSTPAEDYVRTYALRPSNTETVGGETTYPVPAPGAPASGYLARLGNSFNTSFEIRAYAICVKAG